MSEDKKERDYIDVNCPKNWKPYFKEALRNLEIRKQLELDNIRQTMSGLGRWVIRELKNTSFRFEDINVKSKHITIQDRKIRHVIDIYPREKDRKLWCEYCDRTDCEHVDFALTIPEVRKSLEKKGWRIE